MGNKLVQKLPIDLQPLRKSVQGICYVDKTPLIARMLDEGGFYFLSRPRRLGKSLLIDTIAEAFHGNKELFQGLYLENNWDWNQKHPVIRIDFAQGVLTSRQQLDAGIMEMIRVATQANNIILRATESYLAFAELIRELHQKNGQRVVVLVDEYDKPILDNITRDVQLSRNAVPMRYPAKQAAISPTDSSVKSTLPLRKLHIAYITDYDTAKALRDGLRNFYSVLKAQGAHLRFVMLTGVSKFSKVSLFSGLNNLEDITLDPRFGSLCGYTQQELETVFHEHLDQVDLTQVQKWYNGYNFLAEPVYNPFDVLLYLRNRQFKSYWFETDTPTFLVDLIVNKKILTSSLEHLPFTDPFLGSLDVDFIEPQPLLVQTGYLTIKEEKNYPGGVYQQFSS